MITPITNQDDTISSTDIIERIEELRALADEYEVLVELAEQCEGYDTWRSGGALIRASHFTEYVRGMLEDVGAISSDLPWYVKDAIDWDAVAQNIDMDYRDVEFDGITYKMRA